MTYKQPQSFFSKLTFFLLLALLTSPTPAVSDSTTLLPKKTVNKTVDEGQWMFFIIKTPANTEKAIIKLFGITTDVDLYVKSSSIPTVSNFDCRPLKRGNRNEKCKLTFSPLLTETDIYIGVYGYQASRFKLKAILKSAQNTPSGKDDYGNSIDDATPVQVDIPISGSIEKAGDKDFFKIYLPTGTILVETTGPTDTRGTIYSSTGDKLATSTSGGEGKNFRLPYTIELSGYYYIAVSHKHTKGTGAYILKAQMAP